MSLYFDDFSFRTIFRGLINQPEKSLKRISISVQLPPRDEYLLTIKNTIERLRKFIFDLEIINSETTAKINESINKIENIFHKAELNKSDKDYLYQETNVVENELYKLSLKNDEKKYFFNIINLLQESIGHIQIAEEQRIQDDAVRFVESYYEEMGIQIYWGSIQQFAQELRARWEDFQRRELK